MSSELHPCSRSSTMQRSSSRLSTPAVLIHKQICTTVLWRRASPWRFQSLPSQTISQSMKKMTGCWGSLCQGIRWRWESRAAKPVGVSGAIADLPGGADPRQSSMLTASGIIAGSKSSRLQWSMPCRQGLRQAETSVTVRRPPQDQSPRASRLARPCRAAPPMHVQCLRPVAPLHRGLPLRTTPRAGRAQFKVPTPMTA